MEKDRPLSPHLQIYRLPLTAILSVLHRMTGVLLSLGLVALVIWVTALAIHVDLYNQIHHFFTGWIGQSLLVAWTVTLYLHLCNGIRHLIWDLGLGFDLAKVDLSAGLVIVFTVVLTAATWFIYWWCTV